MNFIKAKMCFQEQKSPRLTMHRSKVTGVCDF